MLRLALYVTYFGCLAQAFATATDGDSAMRDPTSPRVNTLMALEKFSNGEGISHELLQAEPEEALQLITSYVVGSIPVIGGALSLLVDLFWPQQNNEVNIWEAIKDQVKEAIDAAILEEKLSTLTNDLIHIHDTLDAYNLRLDGWNFTEYPVNDAAGTQLDLAVDSCNRLMLELNGDDRHLFVALALPTAIAHLTALYERFHFGVNLYNGPVQSFWREELEQHIAEYTTQLAETMNEWASWRRSKIRPCSRTRVTDTKCCSFFCISACPEEWTSWGAVTDEIVSAPSEYNDCEEKSLTQLIVWEGKRTAGNYITLNNEAQAEKNSYASGVIAAFREQMDSRNHLDVFHPDNHVPPTCTRRILFNNVTATDPGIVNVGQFFRLSDNALNGGSRIEWSLATGPVDITFALEATETICAVSYVTAHSGNPRSPKNLKIFTSPDGQHFISQGEFLGVTGPAPYTEESLNIFRVSDDDSVSVRLRVTSSNSNSNVFDLREVYVYSYAN